LQIARIRSWPLSIKTVIVPLARGEIVEDIP
jgi:hypothetical protein